jgi:hypothetical protein
MSITTDGGISGRGLGSVTIAQSSVTASDGRRSCDGTLTAAERDALRQLTAVTPRETTAPGRPDQIRYTLTVGERSASWYGEEPPPDLARAFATLWQIRVRVLGSCGAK